ncbi:acetylglutamate kinase [Bacillus sp. es.036]|uniref:acetylglutamate kinase n=1 Tax=Bacillus sp. es.036 TaxID=1761764 RepID=UPI000C00543C|nr:acetylglutamate kinase [Bacillus sp. es.036]PFG13241.1 N-acetylglutamate kinase [Bacillus sp. es.036]
MTMSESMLPTEHNQKYFVIKCGGSILNQLPDSFYLDLVAVKKQGYHPVLVHGGGPEISRILDKLSIQTTFVDGLRVTTDEMVDTVEMVLSGKVNKQLVRKIHRAGANAIGISGVDGKLFSCKQSSQSLGRVGEVIHVDKALIEQLSQAGYIPVISPISMDEDSETLNINGDEAASAVAQALHADICLVSDTPGVYEAIDGQKFIFRTLDEQKITSLIDEGTIIGGMIPKVKGAIAALSDKVSSVTILDGREENALLKAVAHEPVGTRIVRKEFENVTN